MKYSYINVNDRITGNHNLIKWIYVRKSKPAQRAMISKATADKSGICCRGKNGTKNIRTTNKRSKNVVYTQTSNLGSRYHLQTLNQSKMSLFPLLAGAEWHFFCYSDIASTHNANAMNSWNSSRNSFFDQINRYECTDSRKINNNKILVFKRSYQIDLLHVSTAFFSFCYCFALLESNRFFFIKW